ncbi:DJ-1 family glyoxalase III [Halothermothrix orenii]|uniref:DJ-1 family protein n=1 Tax=Halothermothrix orenii (strain H 168 / OCM 544 / DSM 9562) TaxID=373903 RepID=B8CX62_HALOH|nr:DJ-1 family glyoxalase III [Halothermothrix orenii]ACL69881.1 DJ-1 family protein [Halothermothrix orenii H 168]
MKILIPLAEGFEEIEAITSIDVLRRAGIEVITSSLTESTEVMGSHDVKVTADTTLDKVSVDNLDGILLPGGMPGSANLKDDIRIIKLIKRLNKKSGLIAAICAAPIVLEKAGVIKEKRATSYPGFDKEMKTCNYQENRVVVDGNIITGRGPGVAMEFALTVVNYLTSEDMVKELSEKMMVE